MTNDDEQLRGILERLTSIAEGLTHPTAPQRRQPTPEQSATILDYLVLREVVGRAADEKSRVVTAERRPSRTIAFPDSPWIDDDTRVAVFTARGLPAEVVGMNGTTGRGTTGASKTAERTVTLTRVDDTQPIIRIEIRRADDIAVALGPRLAAVA